MMQRREMNVKDEICQRERGRDQTQPENFTLKLTFDVMRICSVHEHSIFAHSAEYIKFGCLAFGIWCLPFNFHRIVWCVVVLVGCVRVCLLMLLLFEPDVYPSYSFCKRYTKCTWTFFGNVFDHKHTQPEIRTKNVQYSHHRVDKSIIVKTYRCTTPNEIEFSSTTMTAQSIHKQTHQNENIENCLLFIICVWRVDLDGSIDQIEGTFQVVNKVTRFTSFVCTMHAVRLHEVSFWLNATSKLPLLFLSILFKYERLHKMHSIFHFLQQQMIDMPFDFYHFLCRTTKIWHSIPCSYLMWHHSWKITLSTP